MSSIRMLIVEPHKQPYEAMVEYIPDEIARIVGGVYDTIYQEDYTYLFCNDLGKNLNLEDNRIIDDDVISEIFIIAKRDAETDVKDLNCEQITYYKDFLKNDMCEQTKFRHNILFPDSVDVNTIVERFFEKYNPKYEQLDEK